MGPPRGLLVIHCDHSGARREFRGRSDLHVDGFRDPYRLELHSARGRRDARRPLSVLHGRRRVLGARIDEHGHHRRTLGVSAISHDVHFHGIRRGCQGR